MVQSFNLLTSDEPKMRLVAVAMCDYTYFSIFKGDETCATYGVQNNLHEAVKVFEHLQAGEELFVCNECGIWIPRQEDVAQCADCGDLLCRSCFDEMWEMADAEPPICPICECYFDGSLHQEP